MRTVLLAFSVTTALLALPVHSQSADALRHLTRFAGTVERVDGHEFLLKGPGGTTATYDIGHDARITTSRPASLADLQRGKFVGCTAVGTQRALIATECHIFPESMRGAGEGHNPMGAPNTTMTNGSITTLASGRVQTATGSASGVRLQVSYRGGSQQIEVSPTTHLTQILPGDLALIKPGVTVMGAARTAPDGTALVQLLNVSAAAPP